MGDAICMSQRIPQSGQEILSLPDFHDDEDLFDDDEVVAHSRWHRVLFLLLIAVVGAGIIGCIWFVKYRPSLIYQTAKVVQDDLVITVNATGSLHANVYTVNFMGTGKLATVDVTIGQQIRKGQVLAKLDPASLQNALDEAEVNVEVAQTALDNANANYAAIQSANLSGNASSGNQGNGASANTAASSSTATSQPQIPQAAYTVQLTEALGQIKASQKTLALAQAELHTAEYNLSNAILKAPHGGTVALVNGVAGGTPGATFIQIVDPSSLQLQANVREADIGAVEVGDAVTFSVDAYPGLSFNGNVMTVSPLGQTSSGTVTYPVWITMVSNVPTSIHLFPDMTVHATITTKIRTNVLLLPGSALAFAQAVADPQHATGHQKIIASAQIQAALKRANDLVQHAQQISASENPTAAVVFERGAYDKIVAVPVVVGLTNGREYEVLDGLALNDVILVGAQVNNS